MIIIRRYLAGAIIAAISVAAGYMTCPEDIRVPVLLANGEVIRQPCCVTVDGKSVAVVDSEKTAERVIEQVKAEYENETTVDVKIQEETSTENMGLENGDEKPEVLTGEEAAKQLVADEIVTVETKEIVAEGASVEFETITSETEDLLPGESRVVQSGENGFVVTTKEIKKENGTMVSERVTSEKILSEAVPEIVMTGSYYLSPPLEELRVTSGFGPRWGRNHDGVDLGMSAGAPIYAAKSGTVTFSGCCGGYGNLIKIDHGGGMETYYAHCSSLDVSEGQQVAKGEIIGEVGSTGNSTGPHLHFEVRIFGESVDPFKWLVVEQQR